MEEEFTRMFRNTGVGVEKLEGRTESVRKEHKDCIEDACRRVIHTSPALRADMRETRQILFNVFQIQ